MNPYEPPSVKAAQALSAESELRMIREGIELKYRISARPCRFWWFMLLISIVNASLGLLLSRNGATGFFIFLPAAYTIYLAWQQLTYELILNRRGIRTPKEGVELQWNQIETFEQDKHNRTVLSSRNGRSICLNSFVVNKQRLSVIMEAWEQFGGSSAPCKQHQSDSLKSSSQESSLS